ncbi:MAG: hypothetical protein KME54_28890 [Tolypothrix brevis GSE-NOS-MK-07-07A]|jgi:hypothetical protein|nr:hypothetical protein [Tolypothrix brevis GSE-NOS-MK-07-07A]
MSLFGSVLGVGAQLLLGGLFGGSQKQRQKEELKRAKDLALYKQQLEKDSGAYALTLREQESQANYGRDIGRENVLASLGETRAGSDFGRNTKLADQQFQSQFKLGDQQIQGQFGLEDRRQNATTGRLNSQLSSQQLMQQRGFDQQNLYRAQSAALASRGLR